ncbi:MAG: outer membrane beta-barrel protein [Longimicrobiales bacterium]
MRHHRQIPILAAAVAACALMPASSHAQDYGSDEILSDDAPEFDVQVEAGAALPAQDLADYVDAGIHAGIGAAWWLGDHVAVRADGGVDALPGDDQATTLTPLPDMRFYYLSGGVQFDVAGRSSDSPWSIQATAGAGSAMLDTEVFIETPNNRGEDITETYPTVNAGVEVGYDVTEDVKVQVASGANLTFVDETELMPIYERNVQAQASDELWTMPITAAVSVDLPH